jgi:DNA-binding response OmpR family regulator
VARILIVDDDAHIVRVMSIWLTRHGHETLCAGNGADALAIVERESVDLIISDMNMPILDGQDLAVALRERGRSDIPMMFLTARCDQEKLAGRLRGFNAQILPKPFVPSRLVTQIEALLRPQASGLEG